MPVAGKTDTRRNPPPGSAHDGRWALLGILITAVVYLYAINREEPRVPEPPPSVAPQPEDTGPLQSGPADLSPVPVEPVWNPPSAPPAEDTRGYVPPLLEEPTTSSGSYSHIMTMPPLPGVGRLAEPMITLQWVLSYDVFCTQVARLGAAECTRRKKLLERMRQIEADLEYPWVLQTQESLTREIETSPWLSKLVAYDVRCNSFGCLVFLAVDPGADRQTIGRQLAEQLSSPGWSREMPIGSDGRFGGLYPDKSTQWEIIAMERRDPLPQLPPEPIAPNF